MVASILLLSCAAYAAASDGPIRVILPFGPGSGTDHIARMVFDELGRELNQTFVIENRPGGSGTIAVQAVKNAAPDGGTLLMTTSTTHSINPVLFRKLPYDPVNDFEPVAMVNTSPYLLIVNEAMPTNTAAELVDWLGENPTATYAWGAAVSQIAGSMFLSRHQLTATGVPYKSSPEAVTDLIGGRISFIFLDLPASNAFVSSGRVKPLMVTAQERLAQLPDVPTATEAGLTDFDVLAWIGIFAPAGTPEAPVQRLADGVKNIMRNPDLVKKLENCCVPTVLTGEAFAEYVKADLARWKERAAAAGIQAE